MGQPQFIDFTETNFEQGKDTIREFQVRQSDQAFDVAPAWLRLEFAVSKADKLPVEEVLDGLDKALLSIARIRADVLRDRT